MDKGIKVVSLFDGMSCAQLALKKAGIKVDSYFASEIEKQPIIVTQANFPDTVQLGDVRNVNPSILGAVDLLCGGSPCQSFSFAGKMKGMSTKDNVQILSLPHYLQLKADGFEFEGQSYLFWEYVRILEALKPKYFLLENVVMEKKWETIISRTLGTNPVRINSSLVSAQNRDRLYWTNINQKTFGLFGDTFTDIPQPVDEGILLKHVLEMEVADKYFLSEKFMANMDNWEKRNKDMGNGFKMEYRNGEDKSTCLPTSPMKNSSTFLKIGKDGKLKANQDKASCFTAGGNSGGNHSDMDLIVCAFMVGRRIDENGGRKDYDASIVRKQRIEVRGDEKTGTLTSVQKDNLVIQLNPSKESGGKQPYQQNRVYSSDGISPALNTDSRSHSVLVPQPTIEQRARGFNKGGMFTEKSPPITSNSWQHNHSLRETKEYPTVRRLTPTECERLQTVPDSYTAHVSDTARYKMLGNGWTIDVIAHILSFAKF